MNKAQCRGKQNAEKSVNPQLKYNKAEYPNKALLNAVRDGMLAKCSDFSTSASATRSTEYEAGNRHPSYGFISVLIQEHTLLVYQDDYEHDLALV